MARAPASQVLPVAGLCGVVGVLLGIVLATRLLPCPPPQPQHCSTPAPAAGRDVFKGPHYTKAGQTMARRTALSTAFARVELHTVRTPDGHLLTDWLWLDMNDQVNILVEELQPDGSPRYLVFEQSKYGLDGSSLAVVGGLIDERDTDPAAAAARELLEETGRKAAALVPLGRFRADCNRGGGYVSAFLARNTVLVPPAERALSDDLEPQAVVMLSASELRAALVAGRFQEVKWSNTVALGLLAAEAL